MIGLLYILNTMFIIKHCIKGHIISFRWFGVDDILQSLNCMYLMLCVSNLAFLNTIQFGCLAKIKGMVNLNLSQLLIEGMVFLLIYFLLLYHTV